MPYCSIQEAWGNNFNKNKDKIEHFENKEKKNKKKKRRKKSKNNYKKNNLKIPEYNNDNDIEYENWKYKNNLLEKRKKDKGENEYDYYFSRGTQKLEGHNGSNKRVDHEQHFYIDEDEQENEYGEEDLEEEDEEEKETQQLNDIYEDDNINNNIYEEDNYEIEVKKEKKGSKHNLSFVVNKLEKIIDLISDNNGGEDNLIHVALFIFTGIFIIFIIDNAFRMGVNLRD